MDIFKTRRDFLKYIGVVAAGAHFVGCKDKQDEPRKDIKKPNIVLITADDLGIQLGCYGDKTAQTPELDKLAGKGVMFETAWVTQASCSPSRGSIYTGLYPHQNGLIGLCHRGYSMHKEYPTITSILKEHGYKSAVIGKFHIEPKSACPWDYQFGDFETYSEQRDVKTTAEVAEKFMAESAEQASPFFLMLNYIDPHVPLFDQRKGLPEHPLTADDVEPLPHFGIDTPEIREQTAGYYNCVSRLDTGIGMLMDKLKQSGHYENTLVIFVGDHGPPFTRSKTTCYDIGLRVPFIAYYPGKSAEGLVLKEMVSTIDILPTILDAVGIEPPEGLSGKSLMPLIEGRDAIWREYIFGEHNTHQHFAWFPRRTVRDGRYQLIENLLPGRENPLTNVDNCAAWQASQQEQFNDTQAQKAYNTCNKPPRYELYDLTEDPYCMVNLADESSYSDTKVRLLIELNRWREQTQDPFLDVKYLKEMTEKHDKMREEYLKGEEA